MTFESTSLISEIFVLHVTKRTLERQEKEKLNHETEFVIENIFANQITNS